MTTESMPDSRTTLPSWLISLVLHLALVLALGLTLRLAPPRGTASERTAEVGIVLKQQDGDREFFADQDDFAGNQAAPGSSAPGNLQDLLSEPAPSDPSDELPSAFPVIGAGMPDGSGVPSAGGAGNGGRGVGSGGGLGRKARTGVFGIEDEGYKFTYVFDRSASMEWRNALDAAKAELIASLQSLEKTHQFQIIFYNQNPQLFNPTGKPGRMFFATERNKALAAKFVAGITAAGSTDHERALLTAINTQPDVIFFLTDADENTPITFGQLEKIKRRARGITIHAIQFGEQADFHPNNYLVQVARQNGGKHAYVDISRLRPPD